MKKKKSLFNSFDKMDFDLGSADVGANLGNTQLMHGEKMFLKRFKPADLMEIIGKVGLLNHLENVGFSDCVIDVDIDENYVNHLKLYTEKKKPEHLLLDLRVSESKFTPKKEMLEMGFDNLAYDMIVIEWLSAQNPTHSFSKDKPQLPGQKRPGLGILKYCFDMMYIVAKEITKDGFMDVPDHMHGAVMYSKKFKFYNPVHEAILQAILRDLKNYSMLDISWGMITGTVINETKMELQVYDPSEQIFYVSERLRRHFNSRAYRGLFNKYYKKHRFRFNYDEMVVKREEMLKKKSLIDL